MATTLPSGKTLGAQIKADIALKAPLASPTFTGAPKAPTASTGTNTTQVATTAFVKAQITSDIKSYAPLASPTLTGTPKAPTAATGTNTTQIATTAFVNNNAVSYAAAQSLTTAQQKQALSNIGAVSYLDNTLTEAQSAQARTNIDAQSASELTTALSELITEYGGTVPS